MISTPSQIEPGLLRVFTFVLALQLPLVFEVAGWLLVVTSLLIMVAPIRWHGAYGRWLLGRIAPLAIRVLSPVPMMAGAGLIYSAS